MYFYLALIVSITSISDRVAYRSKRLKRVSNVESLGMTLEENLKCCYQIRNLKYILDLNHLL